MEKVCFLIYSALLVLTRAIYVKSDAAPVKNFSGSSYIFYSSNGNWYNWEKSRTICEQSGYNLVSIESREEWNFLKQTIQIENTTEYFIGLRKDTSTKVWRWLSDNSTVNASNKGHWPWATGEPYGNDENCAEMYRDYLDNLGRYNAVSCTSSLSHAGFICEFKGGGEKKSAKATASTITDGERLCSCYTFSKNQWSWPIARDSCKSNNKILAVMESEQEWQFITNEIQNKTGNLYNEWFIGLEKNSTTWRWAWINGKSLTIDKWSNVGINPDPADSYGLIHKEYPNGFKGSFITFKGDLKRGWICEKETAICRGICFVHPVPTSTSPPKTSAGTRAVTTQGKTSSGTKAVTTQGKTSSEHKSSALSALLTVQTSPTTTFPVVTKVDDIKKDTNCFSLYLAIVILSALLFIVMIILAVVLILLRKKQQEIASRNKAVKTSQRDFQESLALNTLNVGPRPEFASRNGTGIERLRTEPLIQQEGVYIALSPESMMTSENNGSRTYTSLVKSTEDSDIEYVNQVTAPEYVNIY